MINDKEKTICNIKYNTAFEIAHNNLLEILELINRKNVMEKRCEITNLLKSLNMFKKTHEEIYNIYNTYVIIERNEKKKKRINKLESYKPCLSEESKKNANNSAIIRGNKLKGNSNPCKIEIKNYCEDIERKHKEYKYYNEEVKNLYKYFTGKNLK